jgi:hypothetical protein
MTSSAVLPWNGASHGPPICLQVIVFISATSFLCGAQWRAKSSAHRFLYERADPCLVWKQLGATIGPCPTR